MNKKQTAVHLAVKAGEILLKSGAEIFRVQETMIHILEAFGVTNYSVYVVSNGIFVTVGENEPESYFSLRNVPLSGIHLGRIDAVNTLSRKIVESAPNHDYAQIDSGLEVCGKIPAFPSWLQILGCAMGAGCFCYIFGGKFIDCIAAFAAGVILQVFLILFNRKTKKSRFIPTILGSALVSFFAAAACYLLPPLTLDNIIIGSIIPLVPGVSFTTAIREFFNGDYISGNIHLTDAVLTGVCIAVGVGTALQIWEGVFGGILL